MERNTIYFITGANTGIGLQITRNLLLRENTTVIATKRSLSTPPHDLENLPASKGSKLLVIPLEFIASGSQKSGVSGSNEETKENKKNSLEDLVPRLENRGVNRIDVLIFNAGVASSFESAKDSRMQELMIHFEINAMAPIQTYQTLRSLFLTPFPSGGEGEAEERVKEKKLIYLSSNLGSIGGMATAVPSLAYGMSKAAANYFVRKCHFEEGEGVVAFALHPGWVKTKMGQAFADSVGVNEPPLTVEESADGVITQIDTATRETKSGGFFSYNGDSLLW
ncbi:5badb914-7def-4312-b51d-d4b1db00a58e [Sclerotinia trifoliorum]|uniref:5badb914-7def-4312-b51d-d4b1db00a58e n=1 Tax=Sclerotinia trifoliorum TaxID=28548 RepID=A0A8H2VYG0_9HELO|nr:5badb914-7def-4312-b51d-d4b1db00a58e [Sclerotinia trifoliorum]